MRHVRQGRQYPRRQAGGRQSVRGLALIGISDAAVEAGAWRDAVRGSRAQDRAHAVSAAGLESQRGLRQSARHEARPMHLLRLLRALRLRQLFQGESADLRVAGADALSEFHRADRIRSDQDQHGFHRQARHRRDLCRYIGRGMGTARQHRLALRVLVLQRATDAVVGHRQALRPADRTGRGRPQLRLSDDVKRQPDPEGQDPQSVHRHRRARHDDRRLQRRQFRSQRARLRRRRLHGRGTDQARVRSRPGRFRRARRNGARSGRRQRRKPISAPSAFRPMAVPTATRIAGSISTRPTRTGSAGR